LTEPNFFRELCKNIQKSIKSRDILNCHSPILTCMLLCEFFKQIGELSVKNNPLCKKLIEELCSFCKSIQKSNPNEKYIRYLMTQKDLRRRTAFQIAAENNFYQVLETPEIGVIVNKMWNGRLTSDGIFASSSFFKYLEESPTKLNNPFERFEEMDYSKCYFYQLCLWTESCSMRYWPESISTILLILLYNLYLYFLVNSGNVMTNFQDLNLYLKNILICYILWTVCININLIIQYIFCIFVKRKFYFDLWGIIEIFMMIFAFFLLLDTNKIFGTTNENGILLPSTETSDLAFIVRALLLAINDICVWMRVTGILLTFKNLGPLLRMISLLSLQTAKLIIVFSVYITCFAGIFTAIFYRDSDNFSSFSVTFTTLFGGFINNFDNFSFRTYTVFGPIMLTCYVTFSGIMLTNLLIALLSNVYRSLSLVVDASHRSVLITYYRRYKWDSQYGFMILLTTPLNVINIIIIPVFVFLSKKISVQVLNNKICKIYFIIFYFPIMLLISIIKNLILLPFCYLKGVIETLINEFYSLNSLPAKICNIIKWNLLGPLFLFMIFIRDYVYIIFNIFTKIDIPSTEKNRIKNLITNEDVILLLQFIHNRSKEDQNDLHTLFINFLYFEQEKKAEKDNIIKEKSYYIDKINSIALKNKRYLKKSSSYFAISKARKMMHRDIINHSKKLINSDINSINNNKLNKDIDNSNNYVKRNIIVIEILENFLIDDGSDNYIVDIQKFKMLLPKTWHIDDRYIKRLVFTEITSLNRAVNNLKSTKKKNVFLQYKLLNKITNSMNKLDKYIDDANDKITVIKENEDYKEKEFYYEITDLLVKVSSDLSDFINNSNKKDFNKKTSFKTTLKERFSE